MFLSDNMLHGRVKEQRSKGQRYGNAWKLESQDGESYTSCSEATWLCMLAGRALMCQEI
jgi:uncharacterized protein (DUF736 family)